MSTENFAQSMQQGEQNPLLQQKLATASDTEQVTKAEGLDCITGELEDQELEAIAGGIQTITVSGDNPFVKHREWIEAKWKANLQNPDLLQSLQNLQRNS